MLTLLHFELFNNVVAEGSLLNFLIIQGKAYFATKFMCSVDIEFISDMRFGCNRIEDLIACRQTFQNIFFVSGDLSCSQTGGRL